ncbi:MAG TPA: hypothetical protein DD388_02035 [Acidimicrobiaceae bacterium]|nr:hypothetical protein [Acidimicrobiaceae bacterium]
MDRRSPNSSMAPPGWLPRLARAWFRSASPAVERRCRRVRGSRSHAGSVLSSIRRSSHPSPGLPGVPSGPGRPTSSRPCSPPWTRPTPGSDPEPAQACADAGRRPVPCEGGAVDRQVVSGRGAATLAVFLTAFGPIIVKISDLAELRFIFWRLMAALVVYLAVLFARGGRVTLAALRTSFWGGLLFGLNLVLFITFMRRTSATHAVIMGSLQPVVLLGVAGPLFGERPRRSLYGWSALALGGVAISMWGGDPSGVATVEGDLLAFVGMLFWCSYYIVSKRTRATLDAASYQAGLTLVAAAVILLAALISGQGVAPPSGADWWPVVLMAALPGTGHLLINYAHAHVALTVMGLINLLFTVIVPLYAWWLLDEAIGGVQALGIAVVMATLAMVVTRPAERPVDVDR